ncbi:MAG: PDZ domain-containing protein [Myxococcales bacterium]|nr:MAG: PDZ domain-containing protein [Myxococcales bacterium]
MSKHLSGRWSLAVIILLASVVGYAAAMIHGERLGSERLAALEARAQAARAQVLARVALLEEQLGTEQTRNAELRADVAWMATRLEAAAAGVETLLESAAGQGPSVPEEARVATEPQARESGSRSDQSRAAAGENALLEAGFDPGEVDAYQARMADLQMDKLYLADRAAREGWIGTDRFREENQALAEELNGTREEFGDDLYDWSLYSSGRTNRVQVASVIGGSPAAAAGIESGDIILSYGEARILGFNDLQQRTREGSAGETARVEVARGDETVHVRVPRGPLGIHVQPTRMEPLHVGRRR